MSSITKPVLLDETGKRMVDEMRKQTVLMTKIAGGTSDGEMSWDDISYYVRNGLGPDMFRIGDQFIIPWKDKRPWDVVETSYNLTFDVVHHGKAILLDGSVVPAMYLQMHYALPIALEFDVPEGVRMQSNFDMFSSSYHYYTVNGNKYTEMKLGTDIPAASGDSYFESEHGVLYEAVYFNANMLKQGNPSWDTSNIRAYLTKTHKECEDPYNFDDNLHPKWEGAYKGDNEPSWYQNHCTFLDGFDKEFQKILKPIKIETRDYDISALSNSSLVKKISVTYDKFFLPSREQMYLSTQTADRVDEEPFEYWKTATELSAPLADFSSNDAYKFYDEENVTPSRSIMLRGVNGNTYMYMSKLYDGDYKSYDYNTYPRTLRYCTPVCAIC